MEIAKSIRKLIRYVLHPYRVFAKIVCELDNSIFYRKMPDKLYLECFYYLAMDERLNLKAPENFNQKIQWIKLYDRNPLYTKFADKYAVREYIAERIKEKYLIPLLGVWEKFDDIDFDQLPNQFVLKCNHDSGSVIICKDKETFDIEAAREKIEKCLITNFCDANPYRELHYKNIKPRVIAEQFIFDSSGEAATNYKFFCFNGVPKCLDVASESFTDNPKVTFFDLDWNILPISVGYERQKTTLTKPENFEELLWICNMVCKDAPFVRVDLYATGKTIYFGELTLTPHGGLYPFNPPEWNKIFGDWLTLPNDTGGRKNGA